MTMGLSRRYRQAQGFDDVIDYQSRAYRNGQTAAEIQQMAMMGASAAQMRAAAQYAQYRNQLLCFSAGTPVHTSAGLKAIEHIVPGDRVWAYDHKELRWAEREVLEVFQRTHQGKMATLELKGETIRATDGHPFWVVRGEGLAERRLPVRIAAYEAGGKQQGRWVLACDLRVGDEMLLCNGVVALLESVRLDEVEEPVYNFRVAELQNYAVGGCGVLVHNSNEGLNNPLRNEVQWYQEQIQSMRQSLRSFRESYMGAMAQANYALAKQIAAWIGYCKADIARYKQLMRMLKHCL